VNARNWLCSIVGAVLLFALVLAMAPGASAQQAVYTDDMSSPALGLMSQSSPDPSQYSFQYKNGQFIAQAMSPTYRGEIFAFVNTPELFNSTTTVDVGIGGADEREIYGFVGCRAGTNDEGYLFLLEPTTGRAALWRQDAAGPVLMAETFVKNLVTPGVSQFNRLGIDCFDNQITGAVNGTIVLTEVDNTYPSGLNYIGIGNTGGAADNLFGVFDNLIVTDQGGSVGPFTMSPNQRVAGPLSGTIVENASTVTPASSGVVLSDFYVTATFTVPAASAVPWDITIGFRDSGDGNEFRLTVVSTGEWQVTRGTGSAPLISGVVTNLQTTPGQINTLEVLVQGVNGLAALNGIDISQFDTSTSLAAGDVWLGTAVMGSTTAPGRSTAYAAFEVWSLA